MEAGRFHATGLYRFAVLQGKTIMNYAQIKECDIANGPGVRVSLFVSGCRNACPGCFNPETWDFNYGQTFTLETEDRILRLLMPEYIEGLTILGGEPFEPENQAVLVGLLRKVKKICPNKSIWCYTGYTYETEILRGDKHTAFTDEMLSLIDVLVDGRFLLAEKDITLLYRGSRNQRILALHGKEKGSGDPALDKGCDPRDHGHCQGRFDVEMISRDFFDGRIHEKLYVPARIEKEKMR